MKNKKFKWTDDKVIDFVNWYIKLHKLGFKYTLENRTIIDSFKNDENVDNIFIWDNNIFHL
jgi:hypothetical protein